MITDRDRIFCLIERISFWRNDLFYIILANTQIPGHGIPGCLRNEALELLTLLVEERICRTCDLFLGIRIDLTDLDTTFLPIITSDERGCLVGRYTYRMDRLVQDQMTRYSTLLHIVSRRGKIIYRNSTIRARFVGSDRGRHIGIFRYLEGCVRD